MYTLTNTKPQQLASDKIWQELCSEYIDTLSATTELEETGEEHSDERYE